MNVSKGGVNPRGLATRGGVVATPDDMIPGGAGVLGTGMGMGVSSEVAGLPGVMAQGMSLGPRDGESIGGAEIVESRRVSASGLTRRKAD